MTLTDFFFVVHAGSWIFIIGIGVKCELPVVKDYGGFLHLLAAIVFWTIMKSKLFIRLSLYKS